MSSSPFAKLPESKPDPIFLIAGKAKEAGPSAINGTVGMFMDETGEKPALFPSVRQAIREIAQLLPESSYGYPPLLGLPAFRKRISELILGKHATTAASIATTGGTEAVSFNLQLLKQMHEEVTVLLPSPAWANHAPIAANVGLPVAEAQYLDDHGRPDISHVIETARKIHRGLTAILLQVGCHNPTGKDFTEAQWQELVEFFEQNQHCIALFDAAYQGFSGPPAEDAAPLRSFAERQIPAVIAWSASKNHGLYSERVGLACAAAPDPPTQKRIEDAYATITRRNHSASPTFGQQIVARVQEQHREDWEEDLAYARTLLAIKRRELQILLPETFQKALEGHGMFALLPLNPEQVRLLQDENVFLTEDGRINIAGIPYQRLGELAEKIMQVTKV